MYIAWESFRNDIDIEYLHTCTFKILFVSSNCQVLGHYENAPMQYTVIFKVVKNDFFSVEFLRGGYN